MNLKIKLSVFILLLCLSTSAGAAEPQRLSLSKALSLAQEHYIDVIISNERIQQTLARLGQARAAYLPQITAAASERRQTRDLSSGGFTIPGTGNLIGPFNSYDARVKLTQSLFDPAAYERIKVAAIHHEVSEKQSAKVREDVLALVATLYIDAWRAREQIKVSTAVLKKDMRRLVLEQGRLKNGSGSELAYEQAWAAYAASLTLWKRNLKSAEEAKLDLTSALHIPASERVILVPLENNDEDSTIVDNFEDIINRHPDVVLAQAQLKESQKILQAEKNERWPKISFAGDYGSSGVDPKESSETYSLGVQASLPIWEGGFRGHKIKESESQMRASKALAEDVKFKAQAKIFTALKTLEEIKSLRTQVKNDLAVASRRNKLAVNRFQLGLGDREDLLEDNAQFILAHDQAQEALSSLWMARINLAHALGTMDEWVKHLQE